MSEAKKRLVQIRLTKAEHDLMSAHVLAAQCPPLLDTAVYHCQQAAEKVVKGFLVFCDQAFDRVHDIEVLVRLAMPYETRFVDWLDAGRRLTPYATMFRYPGFTTEPSTEEYRQAVKAAEGIYSFVFSLLPDEVIPSERS